MQGCRGGRPVFSDCSQHIFNTGMHGWISRAPATAHAAAERCVLLSVLLPGTRLPPSCWQNGTDGLLLATDEHLFDVLLRACPRTARAQLLPSGYCRHASHPPPPPLRLYIWSLEGTPTRTQAEARDSRPANPRTLCCRTRRQCPWRGHPTPPTDHVCAHLAPSGALVHKCHETPPLSTPSAPSPGVRCLKPTCFGLPRRHRFALPRLRQLSSRRFFDAPPPRARARRCSHRIAAASPCHRLVHVERVRVLWGRAALALHGGHGGAERPAPAVLWWAEALARAAGRVAAASTTASPGRGPQQHWLGQEGGGHATGARTSSGRVAGLRLEERRSPFNVCLATPHTYTPAPTSPRPPDDISSGWCSTWPRTVTRRSTPFFIMRFDLSSVVNSLGLLDWAEGAGDTE